MISHPNRGRKLADVTGNSPFLVATNAGEALVYYLRGTAWITDRASADQFPSVTAAQAAIRQQALFNRAALRAVKLVGEG